MRRACFLVFVIILALPLFAQRKVRVGVIDLTAKGVPTIDASIATDLFRSEVVARGVYEVLDRNNMQKILEEQQFQQTFSSGTVCIHMNSYAGTFFVF